MLVDVVAWQRLKEALHLEQEIRRWHHLQRHNAQTHILIAQALPLDRNSRLHCSGGRYRLKYTYIS